MQIPKFRKTSRLIKYVQFNGLNSRLPSDREEIFFTAKEEPHTIASAVASYAGNVGQLDEKLENLLKIKDSPQVLGPIMHYAKVLRNRGVHSLPLHLEECLKGYDHDMLRYAKDVLRGRLPEYLENTFASAGVAVSYAQSMRSYIPSGGVSFRFNPELEERIFNSEDERVRPDIADNLVKYSANFGGVLEEPFLSRLKWNENAVVAYAKNSRVRGELPQHLMDSLAGKSAHLLEIATHCLRGRLPEHLERTITDSNVCMQYCSFFDGERLPDYLEEVVSKNPELLVKYAKEVVRGRLPEHIEEALMGNHVYASRYAFEVIRGFAPVRLPEALHSMMMMMSYQNPDDPYIKRYTEACDSDPNKMKNSTGGDHARR